MTNARGFGGAHGERLLAWVLVSQTAMFALTSLDRLSAAAPVRAAVAWLLSAGCLDTRFWHGQVWRPLTSMWLHGSPLHLFSNAVALGMLWAFGRRCLRGPEWFRVFLLAGLFAGPVQILLFPAPPPDFTGWEGPLAEYFWQAGTALIGASGGVMGLWGAFAGLSVRWWVSARAGQRLANPVDHGPAWFLVPFLLQCLMDTRSPGVAGVAHIAGFGAGFLMGFRRRSRSDQR